MTITIYEYDDEREPKQLPVKWEVCPTCRGNGSHANPSIDGNGLSDECMSDPDFMDDYMGGAYDVPCYECKGHRVIEVLDRDSCTEEDLAEYDAEVEAERRYQQDCAAELRAERRACC